MPESLKKPLYVFLSVILGALLFLILHRLAVFLYLVMLNVSYDTFNFGMDNIQLLALDYFTMMIALMLGGLYGAWVGLYWYDAVYQQRIGGIFSHIIGRALVRPANNYDLRGRVSDAALRLEADLQELEGLTVSLAAPIETVAEKPKAVKKRVVRKKAPVLK